MSVPIVINGATFQYPTTDDPAGWGDVATAFAVAVGNGLIPKNGGTFTLTGDINFGTAFGIKIPYLKQATVDPIASTGVWRLARTGTLAWRNAGNSGDVQLGLNGANQLTVNGVPIGGGGSIPGNAGDIILADGAGNPVPLSPGAAGFLLQSAGAGSDPIYVDPSTLTIAGGVAVVGALPGSSTEGAVVFLTSDSNLYRYAGGVWTAEVPAVLISGQVSTGQIAASAITAVQLAANAVTAAKTSIAAIDSSSGNLTANSVTSANIVAGTIVASDIAAGTITANEMAAGSITTSKLNVLIGSGNQLGNSSFEALASGGGNRPVGMTGYINAAIATTYTRPSGRASGTSGFGYQANANGATAIGLYTDSTVDGTGYGGVRNGWIAGATYMVSFYAKKVNGAAWTTMALSFGGTPPTSVTAVLNPALTTSYQRYVFTVLWGGSVATNGQITVYQLGNVVTNDEINIDDMQIEQGDQATAWTPRTDELLPGTIVANMVAANTITANQIAANTITASNIAANTITSGQIAAGTITATNIQAGAITATKLTIAAIDASGNLNGSTVGAAQIVAGSVTGTSIASNTISAGNMIANTITAASGVIGSIDASVITVGALRGINIQSGSFITTGSSLSAAVSLGAGTVPLNSSVNFPVPGTFAFPNPCSAIISADNAGTKNQFTYTGVSGNSLTGCVGVTAHSSGTAVVPLQVNTPGSYPLIVSQYAGDIAAYGIRSGSTLELTSQTIANGIVTGASDFYASGDASYVRGGAMTASGSGFSGVIGYSSSAGAAGVIGRNNSNSGYGVYGSNSNGSAGVLGQSLGGIGVQGNGTWGGYFSGSGTGPAVQAQSNSSGTHLRMNPLAARPSPPVEGDVAMCYSTGGGVGTRTGTPILVLYNGTNWVTMAGVVFSG